MLPESDSNHQQIWRNPRQWVWLSLGLAPAIMALFSPRSDWQAPPLFGSADQISSAASASLVNRILNLIILSTCLLNFLFRSQKWNPRTWSPGIFAFFACTMLFPIDLAIRPIDSVPSGSVLWPAIALTLLVSPTAALGPFLKQSRVIALLYVYGSLASAIFIPNWAFQPDYDIGMIKWLPFRLYGLSAHSNQLGMVAYLAFLLCLHQKRMNRSTLFGLIASMLVILLAQSKSFFLLLPLTFVIRWCYLRFLASESGPGARLGFTVGMAMVAAAALAVAIGMTDDRLLSNQNMSTFTARTAIWEVSLEEWRRYPLLGYGPGLWDQAMAERYELRLGQIVGGHTHSQFVQVLCQNGLIGMILFLCFLCWFIARSLVSGERQDGLGLCLAMAILIRGAIEPFYYPQIIDLGALSFIIATRLASQPNQSEQEPTNSIVTA